MKTYKFKAWNWRNGFFGGYKAPVFYFEKQFPSAYYADRYASRLNLKGPYTVIPLFGEEY